MFVVNMFMLKLFAVQMSMYSKVCVVKMIVLKLYKVKVFLS